MSMPWDRYQPEDEPAPPPKPVEPQPNSPAQVEVYKRDIDFGKVFGDAFAQALREVGPQLREGARDYARDTIGAVTSGQEVDWGHPTVTATTSQGKELVVADARSRSWRTLLQGLMIDLTFGLVAVLATLASADPFQKETWILFSALLIKTIIQTFVAYVMRLRVTPTIRTPGDKMTLMPMPVELDENQTSTRRFREE